MVFRPEVFVSATSPELDAYRDVVKKTLRELGAEPVEHADLSIAYGPLDGMLKVAIGRCDTVIHLTGQAYGREPSERTHGATRRSFAQYEYDVAKLLGRQILSFVASPSAPVGPEVIVDYDARALQSEHRRAIERGGEHWTFSTPEELAEQIRSLRLRIMMRRRFARMPFPPMGRRLHGREYAFAALREALEESRVVILEPPEKFAALSATSGKSALALEAGWRAFEAGQFDFVLWLAASSVAELERELASLTQMDSLALVHEEVAGHRVRLRAIRQWLLGEERADRVLVILDGVEGDVTWLGLEAMLPWFARGRVIITTRQSSDLPYAARLRVGAISSDASVSLMAAHIFGGEPVTSAFASLQRLAAALGHQPLLLQLAARAMAEARQTPDQYVASLPPDLAAGSTTRTPRVERWPAILGRVVRGSMSRLDPMARGILQALCVLAPQPVGVPQALLAARGEATQTRTAIGALERFGLVALSEEGQMVFVPRAVSDVVRDGVSAEENANAFAAARSWLETTLQRAERTAGGAALVARLVPHCRMLLAQLHGHPLELRAGVLARAVARWLRDSGRLGEAEHFQRRALRIVERASGPGHPDVIPDLRQLGAILQDARRFEEAAEQHSRAVEILEKQPPSRSGELVIEFFELAGCLRAANRLTEAEPVLNRALEIEERISGRNHARTAIALHVLGTLLEIQHRPAEAVEHYRRALSIDERLPICPPARMASRLHHLAGALAAMGETDEALALHQRALGLDDKVYGVSGPELVAPLKQISGLLEKQEQFAAAIRTWRRILAIEEATESTPAWEIAATLTSLATLLRRQGASGEASALCLRALALLGEQYKWHPLTIELRRECAQLLQELQTERRAPGGERDPDASAE